MDPEQGRPTLLGSVIDISRHYDGSTHFYKGRMYTNPTIEAVGKPNPVPPAEAYLHRDYLGRVTHKPHGLARYISPTYAEPYHMIVQATETRPERQGEWRRASLKGHAKTILRLSVWAVGDLRDPRPRLYEELTLMWLKVLLILPAEIILCFLAPFSRTGRISDSYPIFFSRSWDYPTYPRNILDASPEYAPPLPNKDLTGNPPAATEDPHGEANALAVEAHYDRLGYLERLLKLRKLMIR
ncbi:MAG: hypothetical protein Q9181_004103 [Wetmoreana brouardii]